MVAQGPGEAVQTANGYTAYASGYCLQWVRICWEVNSLYASAIDAWYGARKKHPGDRTPPKGAPLFYMGGNYGHIVIAREDDMRSTDCKTSGQVSAAAISWPETQWGHVYLGWAEDLNGVDLPGLTKEEDMPLSEDDIQKIAVRVNKIIGEYGPDGKPRDPQNDDPDTGNQRLGNILKIVKDIQKKVDSGGE